MSCVAALNCIHSRRQHSKNCGRQINEIKLTAVVVAMAVAPDSGDVCRLLVWVGRMVNSLKRLLGE